MKQTSSTQVFVSYSWDSEPHKEKVKIFVQDLRKNGINVIWDEELSYGERIPRFMVNSISQSDFVLFICTPNYKDRADNNTLGVGFESAIITGEIYETSNEKKFVPILFNGTWQTSLPTWAKGKKGVDLSTKKLYKVNFPKLISHLQNGGLNFPMIYDKPAPDEEDYEEEYDISISAIAITPNGLQCVSASSDDLVRLWNIDNREFVGFMENPCHLITALTIIPDGSQCIAISREGTMQVWDMATRKTVALRQIDDRWFMLAAITSNGRWCAARVCHKKGPRLEKTLLWDLISEKGPSLLYDCFYSAMTLSADGGSLIAAWSSSLGTGMVEIINVLSGEKVPLCWKPQGRHNMLADDQVNAIAVTPDKTCIVLGTCKDIAIWHEGAESAQILPLGEWIHSIAVSPDGARLVCGGEGTLYTYDVRTGKCISFMEVIAGMQE